MARGLNKCQFIGHLGKDIELRYTTSGIAVANCSMAVNEQWKDADGNQQEKVEWVNLVFWKKLAEIAGEWLHKGSKVYIEGRMQTRKWKDKEDNDKYTTEIVVDQMLMLDGKPQGGDTGNHPAADNHPVTGRAAAPALQDVEPLPF